MLDYRDRLNEAWDKIPQHRQKGILEELEHKAYSQDFTEITSDEYEDSNPLEPLANIIANILDDCADAIVILTKHIFKN